jgi:LmbE family N-acetylglucosaminyl deacetylase
MRLAARVVSLILCLVSTFAASSALARTIVVFAPHPDDEALLASGVIYDALLRGDTVKVVVATNGDCKLDLDPHIRELETMTAMRDVFGISENDVIFLGYPDCGLKRLYTTYTDPSSVFTSAAGRTQTYAYEGLGHMDYHRYILGVSASYNKPNMLGDVKDILRRYAADDVYVTSGYDDHADHYAMYFFVVEAMMDLIKEDPLFQPSLYEGLVHAPCEWCLYPPYRWPYPPSSPTQYPDPSFVPDQLFPEPPYLYTTPLVWADRLSRDVPAAMQNPDQVLNPKYQALSRYVTQTSNFFYAFVKRDEVFWKRDLFRNLAVKASATASSAALVDGAAASKVNDGLVVGRPRLYTGEWASSSQSAGAWVQLDWTDPQVMSRVVLSDRPNPDDNILAGTLTFSDGSSVPVGVLSNNGAGLSIDFPTKLASWVRFTASNVVGVAGLAEFEAYLVSDPGNTPLQMTLGPTASPGTITDAQTSEVSVVVTDADGDPLTYYWSATGGAVSGTGAMVVFTPPQVTASEMYRVDVVVVDGRGGVVTGSVDVTVNPRPNSNPQITDGPTATASTISDIQTTNLSVTATDADGDVLNYGWVVTGGTITGTGATVVYTPPRVISTTVQHVTVMVTDGRGGSVTSGLDITVTASGVPINVARNATVTASSQNSGSGQGAIKAIDEVVSGYPVNSIAEWAAVGGQLAGTWFTLTWGAPQTISEVVLHDRINTSDRILAGILQFSDGSSLAVGALPNDGASYRLTFAPKTVTFLTLQITSAQGWSTGLAEIEVYDLPGGSLNTAPQITSGPISTPATITVAQTSGLSVTATDADGDSLSYAWTATTGTVSGSGATAVYAPPTVSTPTIVYVTVVVSDGRGGSATGSVTITVVPPNGPPVLTAGPTASPGTIVSNQTSSLSVTANDPEGDPLTYVWTATSGSVAGSGATGVYTPAVVSVPTTVEVSVVVSDGFGGSASGTATITVNPRPNSVPVLNSGPAAIPSTITSDEVSNLSATASDADGDTLTYSWTATGGTITPSGALAVYAPPRVALTTVHRVTLSVSDGWGGVATGSVDIVVNPSPVSLNVAPLAAATASSANTGGGQSAAKAIDGIISGYPTNSSAEWATQGGQLAGTWFTLTWSAPQLVSRVVLYDRINTSDRILGGTILFSDGSSLPVGSLPNSGAPYSLNFAPKTVTSLTLQITAAQGWSTGLAEIQVFDTWGQNSNSAPVLTAGPTASPATITADQTTGLIVSATDVDGDVLGYSWSATVGSVVGSGNTAVYTPPVVMALTQDQVTVTVTDGRGGSVTGVVTVTILIPNSPPAVTSGPVATPAMISDVETSTLSVTATDPNGDAVSYSWAATAGTVTGTGATATYTPPRVTATMVYTVTVTVTDAWGATVTGTAAITVTASGLPINVARNATATASSQNASRGQGAAKAIDGVISGYPVNSTAEWAATGGQLAGTSFTLTWSSPQTVSEVVLHDRINTSDRIMAGTLVFSDGSSLTVGALPNDGAAYRLTFAPKTVTSLTLQITSAQGWSTGLAEIEVY